MPVPAANIKYPKLVAPILRIFSEKLTANTQTATSTDVEKNNLIKEYRICAFLLINSNPISNSLNKFMRLTFVCFFQPKQDFSKYNPKVDKQCLAEVFSSLAKNIGKQTKYASLSEGYSNPTIKKAYQTLVQAKLVNKINSVNPQGLPLSILTSKIFKTSMLDIGIMNYLCGIYKTDEYFKNDLLGIYRGAMAEQFVGQEIIANQNDELFYWSRQAKSSTAEVDYVISANNRIIPVEVKSARAGRLRSMHQYMKEFPHCKVGYVFSANEYAELTEQKLIFMPIYFAFSASLGGD